MIHGMTELHGHGVVVLLNHDELFTMPFNSDGTIDHDSEWDLVTHPTPDFLTTINGLYGTEFKPEHFS